MTSSNIYLFLTELTVIVHFIFILFVVFGGFLANKKRWIKIVHLCSLAWGVFAELSPGVVCPLTGLENYFANQAGLATYQEDFIARYFIPIIYQESLSVNLQYLILIGVIGINLLAYNRAWRPKKGVQ